MIDDLDRQIAALERELRRLGAEHRYVPLLMSAPGIAWVLGYTIAAEIGDIARFSSPAKLTGYTGLCPRVYQSGREPARRAVARDLLLLSPAAGARRRGAPRGARSAMSSR